jgi:hypothetical protein
MLKKYAAVEAQQKSKEQATKDETGDKDIPFGSRAIESGVEVEGIWISRSGEPSKGSCRIGLP